MVTAGLHRFWTQCLSEAYGVLKSELCGISRGVSCGTLQSRRDPSISLLGAAWKFHPKEIPTRGEALRSFTFKGARMRATTLRWRGAGSAASA